MLKVNVYQHDDHHKEGSYDLLAGEEQLSLQEHQALEELPSGLYGRRLS